MYAGRVAFWVMVSMPTEQRNGQTHGRLTVTLRFLLATSKSRPTMTTFCSVRLILTPIMLSHSIQLVLYLASATAVLRHNYDYVTSLLSHHFSHTQACKAFWGFRGRVVAYWLCKKRSGIRFQFPGRGQKIDELSDRWAEEWWNNWNL